MEILIVDDEAYVLNLLETAMKTFHYECKTAASAMEARGLLDEDDFVLMITDLVMPGMDGMELIQMVRQMRPKMPIIAMTGYGKENCYEKVLVLGASDFINKPFSVCEFKARIERVLE